MPTSPSRGSARRAGPRAPTVHLVKLALYAARGQQTPFQTHVRAALKAGASFEEVEHTLLQLLTAEGLGTVVRALKWAEGVRKKR